MPAATARTSALAAGVRLSRLGGSRRRRSSRPILALLVLVTACLALCPVAEPRGSDPANPPTIQDLQSHPAQLETRRRGHRHRLERDGGATAEVLALQATDPKLRAEALRRLGDLNLDAGELQRMESELSSIDVHGAEAIKLYTTLLAVYPNYTHNDEVLYQLARAYDTTGQPDQALHRSPRPHRAALSCCHGHRRGAVPARRAALLGPPLSRGAAGLCGGDRPRRVVALLRAEPLARVAGRLYKEAMPEQSLPVFAKLLDIELLGLDGRVRPLTDLRRADREAGRRLARAS